MKAVVCTRYGPPEVLRLAELEAPRPKRGEACIRIFATAVTASDCLIRGLNLPFAYRMLARLALGLTAPRRGVQVDLAWNHVERANVETFSLLGDRIMRKRVTWIGVAASWLLMSPQVQAQDKTLDELLAEVRLLRQALERQNVIGTRTQLLVSRLALQDQRVARSRAALERLDSELASGVHERNRMRMQATELQRAMEQATDPARRTALEQELRMSQARSRDHDMRLSELQSRQSQAKLAFDTENSRFDELESWMTQLEKELDKLTR